MQAIQLDREPKNVHQLTREFAAARGIASPRYRWIRSPGTKCLVELLTLQPVRQIKIASSSEPIADRKNRIFMGCFLGESAQYDARTAMLLLKFEITNHLHPFNGVGGGVDHPVEQLALAEHNARMEIGISGGPQSWQVASVIIISTVVSATERTREIGLRMALGVSSVDVNMDTCFPPLRKRKRYLPRTTL